MLYKGQPENNKKQKYHHDRSVYFVTKEKPRKSKRFTVSDSQLYKYRGKIFERRNRSL